MGPAEVEADCALSQLIAIAAHELRYPLVPIRRAAALLEHDLVDAATIRRAAGIIERQANGMNRLIGDLIEVSRMQRGVMEMRCIRAPLSDLLECAAESAEPLASERGHTVSVSTPQEPVYLQMDVLRLSQALLNIIANATKYTDRRGHIAVRAHREGTQAIVIVTDTGIGIPPQDLETIFGLFAKSSQGRRIDQGPGIGLYLARQFIEAHGGTVTAASAGIGCGSEFTVRLPCEASTAPSPSTDVEALRDDPIPV
ncbi:MAG: HAMP domain-containing sensor histidine kinase [Pseudomonadota bacterium]